MSDLGLTIDTSSITRLSVHLDEMPDALKARLKTAISRVTHQLLVRVQAAEPVRTGRLRAATHAYVDERPDFVRGRVRIVATGRANPLAARFGALEYGGPGLRRAGKKVEVKGYRTRGRTVASYERKQPRIRARRFLRGPAQAMRPAIRAALETAIGETIREFDFSIVK